ncbi:hypothetical protein A0256_00770 [Mucilaginibacter sp. PAMC 26640]|nr:hypothetical protein A0256_00770 [Mucilaginibacter sp. PAMC 26640]
MQKVVTVHTTINNINKEKYFTEMEFPLLNQYLNEGYSVSQILPVTADSSSYRYALTFVLNKND